MGGLSHSASKLVKALRAHTSATVDASENIWSV